MRAEAQDMSVTLPERTIRAAGHCFRPWPLTDARGLRNADAVVLAFGIARELLPPAQLAACFRKIEQAPGIDWRISDDAACTLSALWQGRPDRKRIGCFGRPDGLEPEEAELQRVRLSGWAADGRLRFRKDRWRYAPRQFSGSARARAKDERDAAKLAHREARDQGWAEDSDHMRELLAARRAAKSENRLLNDPFINVQALMLSLAGSGRPLDDPKPYALHRRCLPSIAQHRALCVQREHLSWGNARDNSYHRLRHLHRQQPLRPTPANFGRSLAVRQARNLKDRQR